MPRVLAVVPARAGSKRLPGKNLKQIAGHSLIGWAVSAAQRSGLVDETIISTDSSAMLVEGIRYGALPHIRPRELATDTATTDSVLWYVMEKCGWIHDTVVLLQPTVPGRRLGLVDECIRKLWEAPEADGVVTMSMDHHFVYRRRPTHNGGPGRWWVQSNVSGQRLRCQDFTEADERRGEDGAVFVFRRDPFRKTKNRTAGRILSVLNSRVVDIDTQEDLDDAEALMARTIHVPEACPVVVPGAPMVM